MSNDLSAYFAEQAANKNPIASAYIPSVIEDTPNGRISRDLFSHLLKDRIIVIDGPIDDAVAATVKAQMLVLEQENADKDIHLYINSPGGVVTAGLSMFDTMKTIKCDVATYGIGQNCSMGSFLLAAGTKGKRFVLPSTRVMTHQPSGGAQGQQTDINIHAKEINRMREQLETYYMHFMDMDTSVSPSELPYAQGLFERDTFFNALAAVKLGHADEILKPANENEKALYELQIKIMEREIAADEKISGLIKMREDYLASKKPANDATPKPSAP